jgi:hypothetical protein
VTERPQYGEYATPEEQAAASGFGAPPPLAPPIPGTAVRAAPPVDAPRVRPRWDSIITTVLLALGAYTVITSFIEMSAIGEAFATTFEQLGVGGFSSFDAVNRMALIVAFVQLAAYVATVALSLRSARQNRITFAIPLIAGVATTFVCALLIMSVVVNDPAYLSWVESQQ